ncbi:DNA adenine methylase [Candidatus Nitrospira nitrificans]|uniref:N6 adenine-specific dna methyltransferase, d12 class n=1 Tax=Candidatus Nitrospira nitrificans TaxID=1742973 RepID=A0A0S4LDP4_9BACT
MKQDAYVGRNSRRSGQMIRHLSPFRYPGGKSWLADHVRLWLKAQTNRPKILVEPFGGGAGTSLIAVNEGLVEEAVFAEIDPDVAATWETVLNGHARWLANTISAFRVTRKNVERALSEIPQSTHERAFQCILRNRTARGGVLSDGAGLIRRGENDRGLKSRWYPETLSKRIEVISGLKSQLCFLQRDGFNVINEYLDRPDTVFFVDPPYTQAARRLYRYWDIDHENLFRLLGDAKGKVLMTYDDTKEVRVWASRCKFKVRRISMHTTHHQYKRELMISRDFNWLKMNPRHKI